MTNEEENLSAESTQKNDENDDSSAEKSPQSTQEFIVEQSWLFLTKITEAVARLSDSVQEKILELGKSLVSANFTYLHTVEKQNKIKSSSAKEQTSAQGAGKEQVSGGKR